MAILVDGDSRVIVQGATGTVGRSFATRMAQHYENFVAGVTPGRGGAVVGGRPVLDAVSEAVEQHDANTSVIAVPAAFVEDAVIEAVDAGIRLICIYSDLVPLHQTMRFLAYAEARGTRIVGPNAAGVVSPGLASACELNDEILQPGRIGVISKSGSLTYEVITALNALGVGQSSVCCLGGDPLIGTHMRDVLALFEEDDDTHGVVLLGEVGGLEEIEAAAVVRKMNTPVVAYVAGHAAPPGKQMGHAGALIEGDRDSAAAKSRLFEEAGAAVVPLIDEMPAAMERVFA